MATDDEDEDPNRKSLTSKASLPSTAGKQQQQEASMEMRVRSLQGWLTRRQKIAGELTGEDDHLEIRQALDNLEQALGKWSDAVQAVVMQLNSEEELDRALDGQMKITQSAEKEMVRLKGLLRGERKEGGERERGKK
jgi:hypothetical protein